MTDPATSANTTNPHEQSILLVIFGMTCQACANRLEKVLSKKDAITAVQVNFASETAQIRFDGTLTTPDELITWIQKAGFDADRLDTDTAPQHTPDHTLPYSLMVLWGLSLPFWVGMAGMMTGTHALMPPLWVQFVLASVVQFGFGRGFYQGAWAGIKGRLLGMDMLVALGTTAIWAYSTYVWATAGSHAVHGVYFEASVMVIAFVSLGKYLEHRTKKQGLNGLSLLMSLIPTSVLVQRDGWQQMPIAEVVVGDVLLARVGDRVAVDGVVIEGAGYTDEAHLTGESQILPKTIGELVLAGSLVADGGFCYRATATGKHTALGDVMTALDNAQNTKANIARLADKVAGVFVPFVMAVAVLALVGNLWAGFTFETALMRAVAVLVIACPCALGLAVPSAIMAGMGVATRHGVIFKDAVSLEQAGRIDVMVFDKTGTLTEGKPSLHKIQLLSDKFDQNQVLTLASSLEQHATHPLAQAFVAVATAQNLPKVSPTNLCTLVGQGLSGDVAGVGLVKIGTPEFAGIHQMDYQEDIWQVASVAGLSVDDVPVALFALVDEVRADSRELIDKLHQTGIATMMLSGDRQTVVDFVAGKLGITSAYGGLSPQDKANKIKQLQQSGKKVAMLGDGINDALAMSCADASFAVGQASDVAKHTASAHLVGGAMAHAYYAQKIAKLTLANIKQNLFFAFIYNAIGIPLAVFGLLNPMLASLAMALSSVSVLTNALRLNKITLHPTEDNP